MSANSLFPDFAPPPAAPKSTREKYSRTVQEIILRRGLSGEEIGGDDIHAILPPPHGVDPRTLGGAFFALAKAGIIAPARFSISNREVRHSGLTRRWRVVDFKAARAYFEALKRTADVFDLGISLTELRRCIRREHGSETIEPPDPPPPATERPTRRPEIRALDKRGKHP
jgi:hypothetical protein